MPAGTLRAVVLGGGLSGLSAAYAIIRGANREGRAVRVALLEGQSRLGGNIKTENHDGFLVESGPDSFVTTRPHALQLCEELGLGPRLIETIPENRRVYIVRGGRLLPMPEGLALGIPTRVRPFLRSPLLSTKGKLRALREGLGAHVESNGGDVSIGEFLERRFGREMVDVILEPLLGGIYAGDAFRLSLRSTFPEWFSLGGRGMSLLRFARTEARAKRKDGPPRSPFQSLRSGMSELVDTLAERVGRGVVRLGAKVLRVEKQAVGFQVVLADGAVEADRVIVALPAHAAAGVLGPIDETLAAELSAIEYVSTATVCFAYPKDQVRHPLDAAGFLVPKSEGRKITAGTFMSSKWSGRAPEGHALLRVFVGGAHDEATASLDDAELVRLVRAELETLLGVSGEPRFAKVFRYIKSSPQPLLGHSDRVARIHARVGKIPGLYVIGNAYDGVGIPDCIRLAEEAAAAIF